jgi:hypothetical protein
MLAQSDQSTKEDLIEQQNEFNKILPLSFQNVTDISAKRCQIANIKTKMQKSGIVKGYQDHFMFIAIYDKGKKGRWIRKEILQFPSWVENGKYELVDLLGDGRKFIKVISDGNRGSNEYQSLLTFVSWQNGKFIPVFMETLSYETWGISLEINYKLNLKLENIGTNKVTIQMDIKKNVHEERFIKKRTKFVEKDWVEHWSDKLEWNENNYSFYDPKSEKEKLKKSKYEDQKDIGKMRLKFLKERPDLYKLDYPDLDYLGIMM